MQRVRTTSRRLALLGSNEREPESSVHDGTEATFSVSAVLYDVTRLAVWILMLGVVGACPALAESAATMRPTTYDDGRSCPPDGQCDAHVVFKRTHNNTLNAFRPMSAEEPLATRRNPSARKPCRRGVDCVICFGAGDDTCMVALYRGNGPGTNRFDFTPAFMKSRCSDEGLPKAFANYCKQYQIKVDHLSSRTNCIANPSIPNCRSVMETAMRLKEEDLPRYQKCKSLGGDTAYNRQQPNPKLHRRHACAYFKNVAACSQSNPCGIRLSPGACGDGYYVGKNGLDCCSADPVQAAIDTVECGVFYPQ